MWGSTLFLGSRGFLAILIWPRTNTHKLIILTKEDPSKANRRSNLIWDSILFLENQVFLLVNWLRITIRKLVILTREGPSDSERAKQSHLRFNIISLKSTFPANLISLIQLSSNLSSWRRKDLIWDSMLFLKSLVFPANSIWLRTATHKLVILTKEDSSYSEWAKQSHLRLNIISRKSSFPANWIWPRKTTHQLVISSIARPEQSEQAKQIT